MALGLTSDRLVPAGDDAARSRRVPLSAWTVGAIVAPGLVIFVLPMVSLIARNEEYFGGRYGAGRSLYLLGAVLLAVGLGLWAASGRRVGRLAFAAFVLLTPAWLAYSALGGLAGRALAAGAAVVVVVAGSVVLARRGADRTLRTVSLFCTVALGAGLLATGVEVGASDDASPAGTAAPGGAASARSPNVYHLVLDEFQTDLFEAALTDEARGDLGGFTWFRDARTPYGRTQMAMASILAPEDYPYDADPADWMDDARGGPDAAPSRLREAGYRTEAYFHLSTMYGDPHPFDEATVASRSQSLAERDDSELARSLWVYSNLPDPVAERLLPAHHYAQLAEETLLPDDAPRLSVLNFRTFLDREQERAAGGRYALVHLILPHFPHVLADDCTWEPGVRTDPLAQSTCALSLVGDLVDELRRLDRFDRSTIVVHGDHGGRYRRTPSGEVVAVAGDDHYGDEWSEARSRSLLLVKPSGRSAEQPLVVSDYPALLTDVMPTILDSIDLEAPVGAGRTSLLAPDPPPRHERYYHFYDEGPGNVPDGWLERYVIDESGLRHDRRIDLP